MEKALLAHGWEHEKLDPYDQRYYRDWMHDLPPLAEVIAQETDVIQIIAPWLTLDGLRILWDLNHPL